MSGEISKEHESGTDRERSHEGDVVEQPLTGGELGGSEPTPLPSTQPVGENQTQTVSPADVPSTEMVINVNRLPPLVELDEVAASSEIPQGVGMAGAGSTSQQQQSQPQLQPMSLGSENGVLSAAERQHQSSLNVLRTQQRLRNNQTAGQNQNLENQSQGSRATTTTTTTTQPNARQQRQQATTQHQQRPHVSIGFQPGQCVTFRVREGQGPTTRPVMGNGENGRSMRVNHHHHYPPSGHWHSHNHTHHHATPFMGLPWPMRSNLDAGPSNMQPPWEQVTWNDCLPQVASMWLAGPGRSLRARAESSEDGRDSGGETLTSLYSCPVCLNHLSEPLQGHCRHTLCGDCMAQIFHAHTGSPPKCPICRVPFMSQGIQNPITISKEHIGNMLPLSVECINDGCSARFTPLLSRYHTSVCPQSLHSCLYHSVGCPVTVRRVEMESHIVSCPYKKIEGLFPHIFRPIKQLQTAVSTVGRRHWFMLSDLRRNLQIQIDQLRSVISPHLVAQNDEAAAATTQNEERHQVTTAQPATASPSSTLPTPMSNQDGDEEVVPNHEDAGTLTESSRNSQSLMGFQEGSMSNNPQDGDRAVVPHYVETENLRTETENNRQALDFREETNRPQNIQQIVPNNTVDTEHLTESSNPQALDAYPGTVDNNVNVMRSKVVVDGLGFHFFDFVRNHLDIMCALWNLGGAVQIEDIQSYYKHNCLEAHAVTCIVAPVFLVLAKDFVVEYYHYGPNVALSTTYMYFTLLVAAMSSVSGQMVGSLPPLTNGCARNWIVAILAVLSGLVLSISTYRATISLFSGSIWSAFILLITWYPSFAIQNILIHGNGKQEQEQRWHATDDHSTGIWHSSIFSVHHMSITSRTITKWADVGYCFAIANLVFGISSVKYLTLGIVMERMFAWSTKAVLGRKTVVINVLEENGKKNKKGMTELYLRLCAEILFIVTTCVLASGPVLLSFIVIFCLRFGIYVWEYTVTKMLLPLHSKPKPDATALPPESRNPPSSSRPDCNTTTISSSVWGNDGQHASCHVLTLTRPVLIVTIAAYCSLLLI